MSGFCLYLSAPASCLCAGLFCLFFRAPEFLLCLFEFRLRRRLFRFSGRRRMDQRAADRTGLPILQRLRQDSRLLVQKSPVQFPVSRVLLFHICCRLPVLFLNPLKLRSKLPIRRKLRSKSIQFPFLPLCLLLFPRQALPLFPGARILLLLFLQLLQAARLLFLSRGELCLPFALLHKLPFQLLKLHLPLFRRLVRGELRPYPGGLLLKPFLLRLSVLLFLSAVLCLRKSQPAGRPLFLRLLQLFLRPVQLSGSSQLRRHFCKLFLCLPKLCFHMISCFPVLIQNILQQLPDLLHRKPARFCFLKLRGKTAFRSACYAADILFYTGFLRRAGIPQLPGLIFKTFLKYLIPARLKELPENPLTFLCVCQKQLQKISLGNHGNLGKLISVHSENLPHRRVYVLHLRNHAAVRHRKLRVRLLDRSPASPLRRPLILGISADCVNLVSIGKGQLHKGRRVRVRILGAQHSRLPVRAAGLPVQRECNRVKDGRLSRSRISRNQIKTALSQAVHVKLRPSRIGTKGGYHKLPRPHPSSSHIFSIRPSAKASCSSLIGPLFCRS